MSTKQLRAVGWAAVSSKSQAEDDKFSLEKQEADIRSLCQRNNWQLIALLRVSGFSRDYFTMAEAAAAMRKEGGTAFDELTRMIETKAMDVFIVRDADRFGRKLSIVTEVTARLRDAGIQIHTLASGAVDEKNATMWSAMTGLAAQNDIERLKQYRDAGMKKRALRGAPGTAVIFSHRLTRNDKGDVTGIEPNPSMRLFVEDAARLFLEGASYAQIEIALTVLGHVRPDGKPLRPMTVYRMLMSPTFWGNSVYGHRRHSGLNYGLWCFDPDAALPDGVEVNYGTHEPALTGVIAERVKAEMRRRTELVRGGARSGKTHMLTGLIVCGECWYTLTYSSNKLKSGGVTRYYSCLTPSSFFRFKQPCSNRASLRIEKAKEQITEYLLKPVFEGVELSAIVSTDDTQADLQRQYQQITEQVSALSDDIRNLIRLQSRNPKLETMYQDEIDSAAAALEIHEKRLAEVEMQIKRFEVVPSQQYAVNELRQMSIEAFWQLEETQINQFLHRLLGRYRFVMRGGDIVSVIQS
jgi:DNA invertase Pin-like site-specific DNA recombinase